MVCFRDLQAIGKGGPCLVKRFSGMPARGPLHPLHFEASKGVLLGSLCLSMQTVHSIGRCSVGAAFACRRHDVCAVHRDWTKGDCTACSLPVAEGSA